MPEPAGSRLCTLNTLGDGTENNSRTSSSLVAELNQLDRCFVNYYHLKLPLTCLFVYPYSVEIPYMAVTQNRITWD